jgi:histidyl-tRNA synthetase
VILALDEQQVELPLSFGIDCYVISLGKEAKLHSMKILQDLREAGLVADRDYLDRKMKAQMKAADRVQAKFVAILGDDELSQGQINVKNLATGEQEIIDIEQLVTYIKDRVGTV